MGLFEARVSKRQLAIRAGMCYTHVLKVLNGVVERPRLETMLLIDEALEQLVNDTQEENHDRE